MNPETSPVASILAVDDTVENLRILANLLGEQNYEVRAVTNGREALLAVEREAPDLILLDINMPDMDGYEVCRELKNREISKEIPVIFLTAMTDLADKVKAFEAGGVDYITKPFQFEEVLARVKAQVSLRKTQQELSESYRNLSELEQLRDNLVNMVVHDMRTPLMVIQGRIYLLTIREEDSISDQVKEDLVSIEVATNVLKRMTDDLLDVSRLESGNMTLDRQACRIADITREVVDSISKIDSSRSLLTEMNDSTEIVCDSDIIRRILENFVNNAIKYTPAESCIRIYESRNDNFIRISVQDEGKGIPPEARSRIFDKFATLQERNDRVFHSAGLGLAFCKLAIEAHGGFIGVDPAEPQGSIFWIELPER